MPKDNYRKVFRYVEAIEKQVKANVLRIRFGRVLLYLLYIKEIEEKRRRRQHGLKEGGRVETEAINSLLEGIYAEERRGSCDGKMKEKIRKLFHQQKRHGERWWMLTCFAGPGVLLVCSEKTGKKMLVYLNYRIFIQGRRPYSLVVRQQRQP